MRPMPERNPDKKRERKRRGGGEVEKDPQEK